MKISKLVLKNFRSHQDTKIDLDRFTFITGQNAVGKSSIAMAVEMLLTGRCAVTDAKGSGAEDLVRAGAREFYVAGQVGKQLVERSNGGKSHTIDIGGRSGPVKEMQELLYRGLGVSGDVLSAVLNSGRFLSMDEKAQKQLLAQVLASEPPAVPQEIINDMIAAGTNFEQPFRPNVEQIDRAHKTYYEGRTATNRELKALGAAEEPELPEGAPDSAAVWKKMDDLRSELTRLTAEKARTEERYLSAVREAESKRSGLERQRADAVKKQISRDELEKATATAVKFEEAAKLAQAIKSLREQIETKKDEVTHKYSGTIAVLKSQIAGKEAQLQSLIKIKGADCPTCSRRLSAEDKGSIGTKLQDEIAKISRDLEACEQLLEGGGDADEQKHIGDLSAKLSKAIEKLTAIGDVAAAEIMLRRDRESIVEIARCDRDLAAISTPAAPDLAATDEKISELNSRIGKGEEVLETVRDFDRKKGAYDSWCELKAKLEARVEILDRLIEFFGPNGIKSQMVGDKIGPFTEAINRVLDDFGYGCKFTLEPYSFRVGKIQDHGVTPKQLSESESFRFGVAFQIALAMATGLKFVVIDRADILDSDSRGALTSMLLASELDQAIVLSTTDKNPPANLPEGVKFIQLGQKQAVAA